MTARVVLVTLLVILAGCGGSGMSSTTTTMTATEDPDTTSTATTISDTTTLTETTTESTTTTASFDNPWNQEQISVYVNQSAGRRNLQSLLRDAFRYWENHSDAATYEPRFALTRTRSDADIVISYTADPIECEGGVDDDILGCAPKLDSYSSIRDSVVVQIRAGYTNDTTRRTLIHEFGHVLGLSHDSSLPVMNAIDEDATRIEALNASERSFAFSDTTLAVYVSGMKMDVYRNSLEQREVETALAWWQNNRDRLGLPAFSYRYTTNKSNAALVLHFGDYRACGREYEHGSCARATGYNLDTDPALEWHSTVTITFADTDASTISYHLGRWLPYAIVGNSTRLPPSIEAVESESDARDWPD